MTDAAFREAYGHHKDALFRFAWRMTGSPDIAEDIVHDCFVLLLNARIRFDPDRGTMRSFLLGVTRNLALKRLRAARPFDELEENSVVLDPIDPAGRERSEIVASAVASLPPLQRETLILAEYEDMSLDEITRVVGADLAAVKSRLNRARTNLRRMLAPLLEVKGTVNGTHR